MRRLAGTTDLLLLATIAIWAFNVSVTKYVLTHGFRPLAYSSLRYAAAALLAVGLSASWAAYSVCLTPLMGRYSPYRISGLVLLPMTALLLLTSIAPLGDQDYGRVPALDWLGLGYAIVGPLLITNVLWF